jgi:cyanophycinase
LFALLIAGSAPPVAAAGRLVIVGGGLSDENEPIFRAVIEGLRPDGPLCILPTASGRPARSATEYAGLFRGYGAETAPVDLTTENPERARDPELAATLRRCGGFFFTGGDQSRIVDVLAPGGRDTPAAQAIRQAHESGAVVAGSSAGAAMMSDPMIGAGTSEEAFTHGMVDEDGPPGVWVRSGMGFLERGITGQHFLARGRLGRLLVALGHHPDERFGFGVDEDTAFVVEDGEAWVLGASQVVVVDLAGASVTSGIEGARLALLGRGDRFDLRTGELRPDEGKAPLPRRYAKLRPAPRPFEDARLHRLLARLAQSPLREVELEAGRLRLTLRKADGFAARAERPGRRGQVPPGLYAGPFELDLVPAGEAGR